MNKLMGQLGKPYRWGGTSPRTGFDCSGLVYYAYKDLVKIHIPRTANEMYHLRDARPVDRDELQSGDRYSSAPADAHCRPRWRLRRQREIHSVPAHGARYSNHLLSEDYWVRHYVGARRVMTRKPFADPGLPLRRQPSSPARSPPPPSGKLHIRLCDRRFPTIAGGRHAKVTVKGAAERRLPVVPQTLGNTLHGGLGLR